MRRRRWRRSWRAGRAKAVTMVQAAWRAKSYVSPEPSAAAGERGERLGQRFPAQARPAMVSWVIARPPYPTSLQPVGPVGQGDADGQCPRTATPARPPPPPSSVPTTFPPLESCGPSSRTRSPATSDDHPMRRRRVRDRGTSAHLRHPPACLRPRHPRGTTAARTRPATSELDEPRKSSCNREGHPGLILPSECACRHHALDQSEPFRTTAEPAKTGPTYSAVVAFS